MDGDRHPPVRGLRRSPAGTLVWKTAGTFMCETGQVHTTRATLDKHHADVASMFDGVARRYDLMNTLMTLGAVEQWRQYVVDAVEPGPRQKILDLAAGTGTSSATFAACGAEVYPTDISLGMLEVGHQRQPDLHLSLIHI